MLRSWTGWIAGGLLAVPTLAIADDHKGAEAQNSVEIKAEIALEIDILLSLDLPLMAYEARAAGIAEDELKLALTSAQDGGLSAASATEVVAAEVEETKKEGKPKDNFGQWVRRQVAAGVKGRELAQAIRERKAELAATSETDEEIDKKLVEQRTQRIAYRKQVHEKRKELVASGQKVAVRGKEECSARQKALVAARAELLAAGKDLRSPGRKLAKGHDKGAPGKGHDKDHAKGPGEDSPAAAPAKLAPGAAKADLLGKKGDAKGAGPKDAGPKDAGAKGAEPKDAAAQGARPTDAGSKGEARAKEAGAKGVTGKDN